jgi:hypothetical protein
MWIYDDPNVLYDDQNYTYDSQATLTQFGEPIFRSDNNKPLVKFDIY